MALFSSAWRISFISATRNVHNDQVGWKLVVLTSLEGYMASRLTWPISVYVYSNQWLEQRRMIRRFVAVDEESREEERKDVWYCCLDIVRDGRLRLPQPHSIILSCFWGISSLLLRTALFTVIIATCCYICLLNTIIDPGDLEAIAWSPNLWRGGTYIFCRDGLWTLWA
jgi:hypothetical protein